MNKKWIYSAIALLAIIISLTYLVRSRNSSTLNNNELSLNDIDKQSLDYNKKQNPQFAQDANDYFFKNKTEIKFLQDLYDYDTITEGEVIHRKITFVNQGTNPFFITELKVSCGCTVPTYVKEPVPPSDTGYIDIEYNSKGKEGFSMNKLAVYGNVEGDYTASYFKVYIVKK